MTNRMADGCFRSIVVPRIQIARRRLDCALHDRVSETGMCRTSTEGSIHPSPLQGEPRPLEGGEAVRPACGRRYAQPSLVRVHESLGLTPRGRSSANRATVSIQ